MEEQLMFTQSGPPQSSSSTLGPSLAEQQQPPPPPPLELPAPLIQQGWRKFWSKREKRPYFFNKLTNESLWEMPGMHCDPITDPLGIQSPAPMTPPVTPAFDATHRFHQQYPSRGGEKRPLSTDDASVVAVKKFAVSGPWNLDVPTNVVIVERPPSVTLHVHPDIEILRTSLLLKLRQQYKEICQSRENIKAPQDSFNRWLMERKVVDKGGDPLLPSNCFPEVSRSMYSEIVSDIPVRLSKPKCCSEARKQLARYAEAAKKMIESRNASPESRKIVKWSVDEAFEFLRKSSNSTFHDFEERLHHLRSQCQPHLLEAAKTSVEGICSKIYHLSCEYAKKVKEKEAELMKQESIPEIHGPLRVSNPKKVYCYPIQLAHHCPKLPLVHYMLDKDIVHVRFKGEILRIRSACLQKLEHLYRCWCLDDRKLEYFLCRVWCLLKRYQGFVGDVGNEEITQVSLPTAVFECLHKHFDVRFECFASPLNCFFRQYCSPFSDTDGYFGSRGSILNLYPVSGSFQAFPPYSEELLSATIEHFEKLLAGSEDALSFILFLLDYGDTALQSLQKLDSSRFKRKQLTVVAFEHQLRSSSEHIREHNQLELDFPLSMHIVFLQNDTGFLRWGPTPERIEALLDCFKTSKETLKEKEIALLSPPPTPQSQASCVA